MIVQVIQVFFFIGNNKYFYKYILFFIYTIAPKFFDASVISPFVDNVLLGVRQTRDI